MGEIAKLIIKIGLVAVLVISLVALIGTLTAYDTSEFSDILETITNNALWGYILNGIAVGKWLFGSLPLTIIIDATLAFIAFLVAGAVGSFVKVTFFDKS